MNRLNWAFGLLIWAVGTAFVPTQDDAFECLEPGCHKRFMTANGRRKHIKRIHLGISNTRTVPCKHGCGKKYASYQNAKLHERTCEQNPNR